MHTTNKQTEFIAILNSCMDSVSQTNDKQEIVKLISRMLMHFTDGDIVELYRYDKDKQMLHCHGCDISISMIDPKGVTGQAFLTKRPSYYNHIISEKYYNAQIDNPSNIKIRALMIAPVIYNDELLGIIRIYKSIQNRKPFKDLDLDLVSSVNIFMSKIFQILSNGSSKNRQIDTESIKKNISNGMSKENHSDSDTASLHLANTVHDIRTPANALSGFLELIADSLDEHSRLKEFIDNARESAELINTLTSSILEQAKEGYTKKSSSVSKIPTIKYLSRIANTFSANMYDKSIKYTVYIDPCIPKEIEIEWLKLERVLNNLLGNAYKFTPSEGSVKFIVKYDPEKSMLKFSIEDSGIGIEPNKQKYIFNAYEQITDGGNGDHQGTGLGLTISAEYVKDLKGKLKLQSELGNGSRFYFSIPVKATDQEPSLESFLDTDKFITILTGNGECENTKLMQKYLTILGMPKENIEVSDSLLPQTTHLICYQHKFSLDILMEIKKRNIKFLIIEEKLFSLIQDQNASKYSIASLNTYFGEALHSFVFSKKKKKVLLVDDDKINISLLKSMLEIEYVEVFSVSDGSRALKMLKKSLDDQEPFDIVYIDEHMPSMSGTQILREYRRYEKTKGNSSIHAISITGDPSINKENNGLYDSFVNKPFNSQSVRSVIKTQ